MGGLRVNLTEILHLIPIYPGWYIDDWQLHKGSIHVSTLYPPDLISWSALIQTSARLFWKKFLWSNFPHDFLFSKVLPIILIALTTKMPQVQKHRRPAIGVGSVWIPLLRTATAGSPHGTCHEVEFTNTCASLVPVLCFVNLHCLIGHIWAHGTCHEVDKSIGKSCAHCFINIHTEHVARWN